MGRVCAFFKSAVSRCAPLMIKEGGCGVVWFRYNNANRKRKSFCLKITILMLARTTKKRTLPHRICLFCANFVSRNHAAVTRPVLSLPFNYYCTCLLWFVVTLNNDNVCSSSEARFRNTPHCESVSCFAKLNDHMMMMMLLYRCTSVTRISSSATYAEWMIVCR